MELRVATSYTWKSFLLTFAVRKMEGEISFLSCNKMSKM